ncbi:MAG: oxidoreductase, partial [Zoogloea sp.]|nr:oxidoreductase [Zoogloea sp.]
MIATDPLRLAAAAGVVLVYMAMCALIAFAQLQKRRAAAALEPAGGDGPAWLVAYASQTGTAEDLAWQTASTLHLAGVPAHLCSLSELGAKALGSAERILFVASTYGEGDPPDNAAAFAGRLMEADLPLGHLHYALLALGDSRYDNFCGFGRALDGWLRRQGAQPLFERIEVDCCDPAALESWRQSLSHLAGTRDAPDWSGPEFSDWRLVGRRLLNPGSVGEPVFHLDLAPAGGCALPAWHSG